MYTGETYSADIERIFGCTDCPLYLTRRNICIYRGNPRADVMIVGEAPGDNDDRLGKPWAGASSVYLIDMLSKNGLDLSQMYLTNTCLCRTPDDRTPHEAEVTACSQWLNYQIDLVKPKVIIAAGRTATCKLVPDINAKLKMFELEGKEYHPPWLRGTVVIPITHPSAIMRAPHRLPFYETLVRNVTLRVRELITH